MSSLLYQMHQNNMNALAPQLFQISSDKIHALCDNVVKHQQYYLLIWNFKDYANWKLCKMRLQCLWYEFRYHTTLPRKATKLYIFHNLYLQISDYKPNATVWDQLKWLKYVVMRCSKLSGTYNGATTIDQTHQQYKKF